MIKKLWNSTQFWLWLSCAAGSIGVFLCIKDEYFWWNFSTVVMGVFGAALHFYKLRTENNLQKP